eukprot:TRINITY_DN776_c0_g1_i1.p1 TRINITY_DN776_c0_g1~~TRINITY_DN776_c0_g1_i1.p1  ORF type:complete len:294 (+),score=42.07 TRINITY_DN776_c0_g1_i1:93-974(+)
MGNLYNCTNNKMSTMLSPSLRQLYRDRPKETGSLHNSDIEGAHAKPRVHERRQYPRELLSPEAITYENQTFKMRNPIFSDFDYSKQFQVSHFNSPKSSSVVPLSRQTEPNLPTVTSPRPLAQGTDSLDAFQEEYTAKAVVKREPQVIQPTHHRTMSQPVLEYTDEFIKSPSQQVFNSRKEEIKRRIFDEEITPQDIRTSQEPTQKKVLYIRNPISPQPLVKYEVSDPQNLQLISRLEEINRNNKYEMSAHYSKARDKFFGYDNNEEKLLRRNDPQGNDFSVNRVYGINKKVNF